MNSMIQIALGIALVLLVGMVLYSRRALHKVHAYNDQIQNVMALTNGWLWETDNSHRYIHLSESFDSGVRGQSENLIGATQWEITHIGVPGERWNMHRQHLESRSPFPELVVGRLGPSGELWYESIAGVPVFSKSGQFEGYRGIGRDVTASHKNQLMLHIKDRVTRILDTTNSLAEATPHVIQAVCEELGWTCGARWSIDLMSRQYILEESWCRPGKLSLYSSTNPIFSDLPSNFGAMESGLISRAWITQEAVWIKDVHHFADFKLHELAEKAGIHSAMAFPIKTPHDSGHQTVSVLEFFSNHAQAPDEFIMQVGRSISAQIGQYCARKDAQERLRYAALHDSLTGLANRALFMETLTKSLSRAIREDRRLAVFLIDLNGFKQINDTYGHIEGDIVLREFSARFKQAMRNSDLVARLGGDEFILLADNLTGKDDIEIINEKILDLMSRPIKLTDRELRVGLAVGVAVYPRDGVTAQALIRKADQVMYEAKFARTTTFAAFKNKPSPQ